MEDSSPPNPAPDTPSQSDHTSQSNSIPQGDQFLYYPVRDDETSANSPQDEHTADPIAAIDVPLYSQTQMPVFPYGNVLSSPTMQRTKRTQCKNACTNCQKACKKCDDNRPCQRCVRYGTTGTCVDSKRKERKKGIKRGPYKKRDGKGLATETEDDDPRRSSQGIPVPPPPYVGPVGYPPAFWGPIPPSAPGGKLEGTGFYQPVLALAPVGGHGGEGVSVSGGSELSHHIPVGFYPVISYPGPFAPFSIPQPHGMAHGFHFAYPPPPGLFAHRLPPMMVPPLNGDQSSSSTPAGGVAKNGANAAEGRARRDTNTSFHANGQTKVVDLPSNEIAEKKTD